jgi:cyclic pyranopterin phosphate synthase
MDELSHVDAKGRASMVDVSGKPVQRRIARARGRIEMAPGTLALVRENRMKKGDVLAAAQIAGIQAAKQTAHLIPLCHPLVLDRVDVRAALTDAAVEVESEVVCVGRTGVEMEALTAVSVALLTVYDMCKAVDKAMRIGEIVLLEKVKEDVGQG